MSNLQYEKTLNWRDYNIHNTQLPTRKLYRSSTLSLYENTEKVGHLLKQYNIKTIIDLRADRELEEYPYKTDVLKNIHYVHAPFDPWNQPKWFRQNHHQGDNTEIAYRFFLIACQPAFQKVIEAIINTPEGGVLIHCHSGKDRTGLLIGAIQFLLGCTKDAMLKDYLASEADTTKERFEMLYEAIEQQGGIEKFFNYQGINLSLQQALKTKLLS